jgi:hypothetical protein
MRSGGEIVLPPVPGAGDRLVAALPLTDRAAAMDAGCTEREAVALDVEQTELRVSNLDQ